MTDIVDNQQPIDNHQQLSAFLSRGARPRHDWGVGLETEKLVIDRQTGEAASYEQIRQLLLQLEETGGWQGNYDGDNLIGLQGKLSAVSLEPGGQLELSGRFCCDIHCTWRDFGRYRQQLTAIGAESGLAFLGLGVQPFSTLDNINWLPKKRYDIMGPYMLKTGDMGQRMMKQTAGTQVNLDYLDEADCIRKLRVVQWLSPLCYALFANSPILEDRPNGFLSLRGEIWSRTDADRCGIIEQMFDPKAGFDTFIEYALDIPLYFLWRENKFIDLTGSRFTFRQYLKSGWQQHRATLADWDLHLSTIFPEVRLRPQIEIRSADSLPPLLAPAVAAFYKGLLYSEEALATVERIFQGSTKTERQKLHQQSCRTGLQTEFRGGNLREIAAELLTQASKSLQQQFQQGDSGADESQFLQPLEEIVASGKTLAEKLLERWQGGRQDKLAILLEHCGY